MRTDCRHRRRCTVARVVPVVIVEEDSVADRTACEVHAGHAAANLPPEITFPYGFPKPGRYRIFVQVKLEGNIESGVFDATVQ